MLSAVLLLIQIVNAGQQKKEEQSHTVVKSYSSDLQIPPRVPGGTAKLGRSKAP